jgi:predicted phage terminase large subunit-like protein
MAVFISARGVENEESFLVRDIVVHNSGGKESAENSVRLLKGFRAYADKVTGSKELRAEPYAAQVQGGNVKLVAAQWNRSFLTEHEEFPTGRYKDQVDAATGAFNKLISGSSYDPTYSGWN